MIIISFFFKSAYTAKNIKSYHSLLIVMSFQTWKTFFLQQSFKWKVQSNIKNIYI